MIPGQKIQQIQKTIFLTVDPTSFFKPLLEINRLHEDVSKSVSAPEI